MIEQTSFHVENTEEQKTGPVECLGFAFENETARREHFLDKLRDKLRDPEFRKIEGFPIVSDEDILALSDPPYYTACPNPFIADFIEHYGRPYERDEAYIKEPFAADVSEGKNDPIYNAHSYHTKVPHKAIMRYILQYTKPGDIVLDGFCGTGMTGVAAQICANRTTVESLGYTVLNDGAILDEHQEPFSSLGSRRALLYDLSPAATFIAYNYNSSEDPYKFEIEAFEILERVERECSWMYQTLHRPTDEQLKTAIDQLDSSQNQLLNVQPDGDASWGRVIYTIWSDVFVCPECASEVVYWDAAVDKQAGDVREEFPCPECHSLLTKRTMEHAWVTRFDRAANQLVKQVKQVPVSMTYSFGGKRFEKKPDMYDFTLVSRIEEANINSWFPSQQMLFKGTAWGESWRAGYHAGITNVHHFYTKRNLWTISTFYKYASSSHLKWAITGIVQRASKQHQIAITRIGGDKAKQGGATAGHRRGTLYIPSNQVEYHPLELIAERIKAISKTLRALSTTKREFAVSTCSTEYTGIASESVDYIFVDPPFGGNIMYSELNFLWEAWLGVFTNNHREAIENRYQRKGLFEYQEIMTKCFQEFYRVLKPGRWLTVEFHNSKNSVWNAIQEALQLAGFVIADVRMLNKKILTHTQRTSAGSVSQDLVISAYRPDGGLEERFKLEAGTQDGVWDFVRTHLGQLPIFVETKSGGSEVIVERQNYLLFDRMVAFHVQRGVTVPLSASEMYAGLVQRFPQRDEMYFLPEQVAEYERRRMTVREIQQLQIFVSDESSAIQWLRQQLGNKPQTTSDLTPQFMKELAGWQKHEVQLELSALLEENFLRYTGDGPIPAQIVTWLKKSSELREIIQREGRELENGSLETNNTTLKSRAKDRWYVPDPNKAIDLEKLRLKGLLREFATYVEGKGRLKQFRTEAVRAGFAEAWRNKDYTTIVRLAERLPEAVLQEDPDLLMYYDNASLRVG